ncbi:MULTISPECIES: ATP-binding cassette domain-containing protein [Myroides]|uniref:ATP-binding cassette domain-containing protein n=1 Tax=Myroides albus TaxID=2562892 RepID=A0A6I3LDH7_9FLAO|nr:MULTISPECIES: ATP-binding cassette domain-containing protein [Myroides]MTG97569.1 ATP-binding cassette domain-containing protein [Myroides albus]MVX36106.1 ATP-binding cassette domain-containing protein [Myroides sp. LoEW2-1]UVD81156.1 ATP-binding cassette domain-containing protein [Myroides albus]
MSYNHTLHVDSLQYTIDNKTILNGIYFTAVTGDVVSISGRNGTGKSTLMKIMFGILKADHSYIRVDHTVITNRYNLNQYFSYKPQFNIFPKHLRVKEVLKSNDTDLTPIQPFINSKIKDLSKGEQQLIQTLYILNLPQPICLLDEPFAGLSPILQEFIAHRIKEKARDKIIIVTDHNTELVSEILTKNLILENGILKEL